MHEVCFFVHVVHVVHDVVELLLLQFLFRSVMFLFLFGSLEVPVMKYLPLLSWEVPLVVHLLVLRYASIPLSVMIVLVLILLLVLVLSWVLGAGLVYCSIERWRWVWVWSC